MHPKINFTSDWSDAVYAKRNSIVFENKNQAYGAFVLRNNYERNILFALLLAGILFSGILILPNLFTSTVPMITILPKKTDDATKLIRDKIIIKKDIIIVPRGDIKPPSPPVKLNFTATAKKDIDTKMDEKPPVNPGGNSNSKDTGSSENTLPDTETEHVIVSPIPDPNKIWPNVQQMPVFPGGDDELYKFLNGEMRYPDFPLKNGIQGTVYLSFVINQDGSAGDIKVLRGVDNFLNAEAIRVLQKMPKWKPGKQNGNPVRVQLSLPVKFKIRDN